MSNSQDIFYVVRVSLDGEKELVKFTGDIKKLNQEGAKSGEVLGKFDNSLKKFTPAVDDAAGKTKKFNKGNSTANNLLIELTRGASDAQYGIRGLGNNLEQATVIGARAYEQFGSVGGVMRGLGKSMMGPTGAVAGVTALTIAAPIAINWIKNLGGETKDFAADSEEMISKLKSLNDELTKLKGLDTGSIFDTESNLEKQRFYEVFEEDLLDQKRNLEGLREAANLTKEQLAIAYDQGRVNVGRDGRIISVDYSQKDKEDLAAVNQELKRVTETLSDLEMKVRVAKRLKDSPTAIALAWEKASIGITEYNKELLKSYEESANHPVLSADLDSLSASLAAESDSFLSTLSAEIAEQQKFNITLTQMRLQVAKGSATELEKLEIDRQSKIEEIRNYELITERQRKDALALIDEEYAQRRLEFERQQAEERNRIEEQRMRELEQLEAQVSQRRVALQDQTLSAIVALQQGFASENKELALTILAIEKGLAISRVIAEGARASGEAQFLAAKFAAGAITPLGPNPMAIAGAANAQAQAARIKLSTGLTVAAILAETVGQGAAIYNSGTGSGSTAGNNGSFRFDRSSEFEPSFSNPQGSNSTIRSSNDTSFMQREEGPKKLVITDGFGNIVARGQEENDATGSNKYVRGT